jgi:hypothetical protein
MNDAANGNSSALEWVGLAANQSRLSFGLAITELAERDGSVVAVGSDTLDLIGLRKMQERHPERVVDVGIAEQNAMGIASGLATTGMHPYLGGYAPFTGGFWWNAPRDRGSGADAEPAEHDRHRRRRRPPGLACHAGNSKP